jgi:hypothetical protein
MTGQLFTMRSASSILPESQFVELERADFCRRLAARVVAIKQILVQSYLVQGVPSGVVREAIAMAEAEAWRAGFPDLFLPDLADEILRRLLQKGASIHPEYAQAA